MIRKDAEQLKNPSNPVPEMLRLAESLVYEQDDAAVERAQKLAKEYLESIQQLSPDQLEAKKDELKHLRDVAKYLAKWGVIPDDAEPKVQVEQLIKEHGWDKK